MKIAIISMDTRGGVQPYLALALGLRQAGHDLRLVIPPNFVQMVAAEQIEASPLGMDTEQMLRERGLGGGRPEATRAARREILGRLGGWMLEARSACAGVDLIMAGATGRAIGRSVAEALGTRFLEAHLQPVGAPTTAFPGVYAPNVPGWLGGPGNWLSHVFTDLMLTLPLRPALGRARRELGLPARPARPDPHAPTLYGFSPRVLPPPPSWQGRRHVTGYWTMPAPAGWAPPPELTAFLDAGPPPVCFGFGSMPTDDPAGLAKLMVDAARQAGARALLLSGWGGLQVDPADDVCVLDGAPHEWLFPRTAVTVHHGGAGTTGAALRAGRPTVVIPHGADQPFWAGRVTALGVGPAAIPREVLTAPALAAALGETLNDASMRERASLLGDRMRTENGAATAAVVVDGYLTRLRG